MKKLPRFSELVEQNLTAPAALAMRRAYMLGLKRGRNAQPGDAYIIAQYRKLAQLIREEENFPRAPTAAELHTILQELRHERALVTSVRTSLCNLVSGIESLWHRAGEAKLAIRDLQND